MAVALADAQVEPAAGHEVQRRGLLGEQDRVVPGQHQHGRAEAERRRPRGDPGQQLQRRRDLAPAAEVMLDQEGGPESECLRLHAQLDELVEPLARGSVGPLAARLRAAEDCEPHRRAPGSLGPSDTSQLRRIGQYCALYQAPAEPEPHASPAQFLPPVLIRISPGNGQKTFTTGARSDQQRP
jgi:hypothetical protein